LLEAVGINASREAGRHFVGYGDGLVLDAGAEVVDDALDLGVKFDGLTIEGNLSAFQPRDGEEVFDEKGETLGLLLDGLKEADAAGAVFGSASEESFDESFDEGKRGAEFVADIGDEFLAGAFELLDEGDVVKDQDGGPARRRR
jgi:hypothetical protein